jgi:uncharacterized membrane protein YgcG
VAFWLGFKGREMAWKARQWESLDHFNRVQRKWSRWAVGICAGSLALTTLVLAVGILMGHAISQPKEATVVSVPSEQAKPAPSPGNPVAEVPPLRAHVNDLMGMLNATQGLELETLLSAYEKRSGHQVAVLLIKSTAPERIDQYSLRAARSWKLGRQGVNDGVLFVVAYENPHELKRLRIEVGAGLSSALSEDQSAKILQDVVVPHFRNGQYALGIGAGISEIMSTIDAHEGPTGSQS